MSDDLLLVDDGILHEVEDVLAVGLHALVLLLRADDEFLTIKET